jgi:hypothetical protein
MMLSTSLALLLGLSAASAAQYGSMAGAGLGQGASLNGAIPFPADNAWNTDISAAPVDPNSDAIISHIPIGNGLHPDFGAGTYAGAIIGIPYFIVDNSQPKLKVKYVAFGDQSDPGPMPIPANVLIEGYHPNGKAFGGDRHVLVINRDSNLLYELFNAHLTDKGFWKADSGAIFHLDSNNVRPTQQPGWTSADAAGLPIFPGLARYDEASTGTILHALRFTVSSTRKAYLPPANHWASASTDPNLPPMGMRVRLKASYVIPSAYSKQTRAILKALQKYGMIVADNGSDWYISGTPDSHWNNDHLVSELREVTRGNFEVVKMTGLVTP